MNQEEIHKGVAKCIAEALEVRPNEVTPEAKIIRDLGAESVDLLDIVFRLERNFKVRIPRGQVEKQARNQVKQWRKGGVLTEEALEVLRTVMPEVDPAEIKTGLKPRDIPRLFNVQTFVNMVAAQVEASQDESSKPKSQRTKARPKATTRKSTGKRAARGAQAGDAL